METPQIQPPDALNIKVPIYRIVVAAGEISGDHRAAEIVRALKEALGDRVEFRGMGGQALAQAGMELIVDAEQHGGAMGFAELFGSLGKILSSLSRMKRLIASWRPDLLIVVDYPDFNLRLATYAKKLGIKVLDYIPPKVWAWRSGRVRRINQDVDKIAAIFPFEPDFFAKDGCKKVTFVGHPFVSELSQVINDKLQIRRRLRDELNIPDSARLVAIFPGSRVKEIERHMATMTEALIELKRNNEDLVGCIVSPNKKIAEQVISKIPSNLDIKVLVGRSLEVLASADLGILKSGTCNLEAAFLGLPFVCIYKGSEISVRIAAALLKIKEVSLVNIMKPGTVRELLQWNLTTESLVKAVKEILPYKDNKQQQPIEILNKEEPNRLFNPDQMRKDFSNLVNGLRPPDAGSSAPQLVAKMAISMLEGGV